MTIPLGSEDSRLQPYYAFKLFREDTDYFLCLNNLLCKKERITCLCNTLRSVVERDICQL